MTANQEPPGPRRSRHLSPDELARELANRLKYGDGPVSGRKRILPEFDLLNAGRLIMGFGALLLVVGLVVGFVWLSGLSGYETTGTVTQGSPGYGCPGGPELGELFEGEKVALIGRSPDRVWLVARDDRGPGNAVYVFESVVAPEGDVTLLPTRECEPSDGQPVAAGQTTTISPGVSSSSVGDVTTTPSDTTLTGVTVTSGGSGFTGTSGTTPRTSTTVPYPGIPTIITTTTQPTTTTSTSTSTSTSSTSTTEATTTTTEATTTTTSTTFP